MAEASPARLYASLVGAVLLLAGIAGFFYSSSFGSPGPVGELLGAFAVNGWLNLLHLLTGALGLLVAGFAPRRYAFWMGIAYLALAGFGFGVGDGDEILGILPVNTAGSFLHLTLGALGLGAALGTPKNRNAPRDGAKRAPRERPVNAPAKA